jgi:hypothetical protein
MFGMRALQIETHRAHKIDWLRVTVHSAYDGVVSVSSLMFGVAAVRAYAPAGDIPPSSRVEDAASAKELTRCDKLAREAKQLRCLSLSALTQACLW